MKIALIVEHADAAHGGAEQYTIQLASALAERGHAVTLIARLGSPPPPDINLVLLPAKARIKSNRYAQFLRLINTHLRDNSYDIVHAMMPVNQCDIYHPHAGLAAEAMARGHLKHAGGARQSLSHLTNQLHLRRRYFRTVERKLLASPHAPVVLCVSKLVKREVLQHYKLPDDRLAVLFNAVDLDHFDLDRDHAARGIIRGHHHIVGDKVVALLVAQNFRLKGLATAIEALAAANDPRLMLLVIGKESPAPYRRQARKLGIEHQIIFAGSTNDIYSYYAAADFLVLPTMRDSCSLVVLEALAMSLPVISTTTNGACEIMANGREGFILDDPKDVASLARAMTNLSNDNFRAKCAAYCQQLRPRLSYTDHMANLLAIYENTKKN